MNLDKIFIIAEIGVTCNYDLEFTGELIKKAKESGADAVKFVFHFPDELMADNTITYTYDTVRGKVTENMFNMFNHLRFTLDEWFKIKNICEEVGIEWFSSVDCDGGIEYGEKLGFNYYKLGSWDVNDILLLEKLAQLNKPVIIDIGASPEKEIKQMIDILGVDNTIILHDYHTDNFQEMNMISIPYLKEKYGIKVGYSSPNYYDNNDYIAVALGAQIIEKRLTLDKNLEGHHHILCKTPDEFKEWVINIRNAEMVVGEKGIFPSQNDLKERKKWFKHICAETYIPKNTIITKDMLTCKRHVSEGLDPNYYPELLGRVSNIDINVNEPINLNNTK